MSNEKPSFFKVLSSMDFTKLLRIPPDFIKRYESTMSDSEYVKLRVHSGRTWRVKVKRLHNGLFCFTEGWQVFARDVDLQLGEFLVFTLLTTSKFDVVIYDKSFCERVIIPPSPAAETTSNRGLLNDVGSSGKDDPLYFEVCLHKQHSARIYLPTKFSSASGMYGRNEVMLEYLPSNGRKSVVVDHRVKSSLKRFDLADGWGEFRVTNGLVWGKIYSFEFKPDLNLIHVNIVRN